MAAKLPLEKGVVSSRIIAIHFEDGTGRPLLFLTEEFWEGTSVLKLPGGKCHQNEEALHGAARELREETPIRRNDRTPFVRLYIREGERYDTHVFACIVCRRFEPSELVSSDTSVEKVHVVDFDTALRQGVKFRTAEGLRIKPSHVPHLREFASSSAFTRIKSCVTKETTKEAS